ncbi:hypothetical protein V8E36_006869 [Tilletia maclaganii]
MQLHVKAVLIALFFSAIHVHAYSLKHDENCAEMADDNCGVREYEGWNRWKVEYAQCMSDYWRSLPTDGNCPHRQIGCHCYQGCVQDRYTQVKDVGKYCVDTCTQANMPPSRDCGAK